MGRVHPTLTRLDLLAAHLSEDSGALAVLGLGSAGVEHDRFDDYSDIDFFLVVADAAVKQRHLDDIGWLAGFGGEVAYSFVNDPNGRKALFADGLFLEYAVFTAEELPAIPFTGARVVWQRPGRELELESRSPVSAPTAIDTVDFHLNEALTNLYVGLLRELRGERLAATRFIQGHAVDRVLSLLRLESGEGWQRDPFDATRRVESGYAGPLPLAEMIPGYGANASAAAATLGWLRERHRTDPHLTAAIEALISRQTHD